MLMLSGRSKYPSLGTQSGEEVVAEEGLDLHWAAAGVRLGQAPDALRLEVESVLKSWTPAVLHVRVSRDDALVEAGIGTEIFLWVFFARAAVALPWLHEKKKHEVPQGLRKKGALPTLPSD